MNAMEILQKHPTRSEFQDNGFLPSILNGKKNNHDSRSLEPKSRDPNNTRNRKRISQKKEDQIVVARKEHPYWGQEKISIILERDHKEKQDYIYNYERPHQALGYLTPMEFHKLWKKDQKAAYAITAKYQTYLKKQSKRLATSRRMKNKEKIEALMLQIDQKLSTNFN